MVVPKHPRRRSPLWLIAIVISAGLASAGHAASAADTPETRRAAAEEFLAAVPVAEEVDRLIHEMSEELPENRREAFVQQMHERVDMTYMTGVMRDGLLAHLTAAELKAAAKFYGSPEGKAVRQKLPRAIDDITPLIQAELMRSARRLAR